MSKGFVEAPIKSNLQRDKEQRPRTREKRNVLSFFGLKETSLKTRKAKSTFIIANVLSMTVVQDRKEIN